MGGGRKGNYQEIAEKTWWQIHVKRVLYSPRNKWEGFFREAEFLPYKRKWKSENKHQLPIDVPYNHHRASICQGSLLWGATQQGHISCHKPSTLDYGSFHHVSRDSWHWIYVTDSWDRLQEEGFIDHLNLSAKCVSVPAVHVAESAGGLLVSTLLIFLRFPSLSCSWCGHTFQPMKC